MPILEHELARREGGRLVLRPAALPVRWTLDRLVTSDGFPLRAALTCGIRPLPQKAETKMLEEVFLARQNVLTAETVTAHFAPTLAGAAVKTAARHTAAQWVGEGSPASASTHGEMTPRGGEQPNDSLPRADGAGDGPAPSAGPAGSSSEDRAPSSGGAEPREAMIESLRAAGRGVAFACGVEFLPPFLLELDSPSYRQQKQEEVRRSLAEKRVAAGMAHLERAGELLRQFESVRQASPGLSAGAALDQVSPADRGTVLQSLLMASAREKGVRCVWLAAGPYLVRIADPRADPPSPHKAGGFTPELIPLPPTLGPLRSIQPAEVRGKDALLVGAKSGVMVVPVSESGNLADDPTMYGDPAITSQNGFSKAVVWNDGLWACHGEAGIVGWDLGQPDQPLITLRPSHLTAPLPPAEPSAPRSAFGPPPLPGRVPAAAPAGPPPLPTTASGGASTAFTRNFVASFAGSFQDRAAGSGPRPIHVRNLTVLDEARLIFSVGDHLLTVTREGVVTPLPAGSRSDVVAILPEDQRVFIVHEDGSICSRDRASLEVVCDQRRNSRTAAAAALPWLGGTRLLLAGEAGPVQCVGFDDPLVTEYFSPHRAPRMVAGSAALVAAVSSDRQRLILWNSWDGRQPVADLSIAGIVKHRITDVDFG